MEDVIDLTDSPPAKRPRPPQEGEGRGDGGDGQSAGGKRPREGGAGGSASLSAMCARVLEFIPDADLDGLRVLLGDLSEGGGLNEDEMVQQAVQTLLAGWEGAVSAAEKRDHELALSLQEGEAEGGGHRSAAEQSDHELALSLLEGDTARDESVARDLLAKESLERDRQLALEFQKELQHANDDQVRQPKSACVKDAAADARFLAEEASGRTRRDLTDMIADLMREELSHHKGVKGPKQVVVCADVEFFGSSVDAHVRNGASAEAEDAVKEEDDKDEKERYKRKKEGDLGWGCGYRNIQMLVSHMFRRGTPAADDPVLPYKTALFGGAGRVVSVAGLQGFIEEAWGHGYDDLGAEQLGYKLVDTEKWIGTTEAVSLFRCAGLRARFIGFKSKNRPHEAMWEWVKKYFDKGTKRPTATSQSFLVWRPGFERSSRPPLYMQHLGHSRTIIGYVEIGEIRQLLVLDPGNPAKAVQKALEQSMECLRQGKQQVNRWQRYIKRGMHTLKHEEFELVYFDDDGLLPNAGKGPGSVLPRSDGGAVIMTEEERDACKHVGADQRIGYDHIDTLFRD